MSFTIRPATREKMPILFEWAAKEGWNPGLYYQEPFYSADPNGFLLGFLDDQPIASISAVAYDNTFGFLGFYIVKPEYRNKGYGIQIWNAALAHLPTQTIGLDGVLEQQENYKKSGFTLAYRNIRYEGIGTSDQITDPHLTPLSEISFKELVQYDTQIFPTERATFLKHWIVQPKSLAVGYQKEGKLLGYGVVTTCRAGHKIGPLFADTDEIADILFQQLRSFVGTKAHIFLDTPEINKAAIALANRYDMKPMFETARMYNKQMPKVALAKSYGVTTFELG